MKNPVQYNLLMPHNDLGSISEASPNELKKKQPKNFKIGSQRQDKELCALYSLTQRQTTMS